MYLTNSVDWDTGSNPFLDVTDHAACLRVGGGVETFQGQKICNTVKLRGISLVIIDVELRIWVRSTGCFEGDPYKVFSNYIVEDAVA